MSFWANNRTQGRQSPPVKYNGLKNQGATCYLNSVLQVLFMTKEFRDAVESSRCDNVSSKNIDCHLQKLFADLKKGTSSTVNITKALGIQRVCEQRDSAEYFEKILSLTSRDASKIFHGVLTHKNKCNECSTENNTNNPFWSLPLALVESKNEDYSVLEGIYDFFKSSEISGENQMYCDHCDAKADATIKCEITTHPDVLTLLLKRFEFDYYCMRYVKINCRVDVPRNLHITEDYKYELYGVVEHVGDLRGGHYTSTIKSKDDDTWYKFNDGIVTMLNCDLFQDDHIKNSNSAYLLFYRKKKTDTVNQGVGKLISPEGLQTEAGWNFQTKEKQKAEEVLEEGGLTNKAGFGSIAVEQMIHDERRTQEDSKKIHARQGYTGKQEEEEEDRTVRTGVRTEDEESKHEGKNETSEKMKTTPEHMDSVKIVCVNVGQDVANYDEVKNHDYQKNVNKQGTEDYIKEHNQQRKRKSGDDHNSETPLKSKRTTEDMMSDVIKHMACDQNYRVEGNEKYKSNSGDKQVCEEAVTESNQQSERRAETKGKEPQGKEECDERQNKNEDQKATINDENKEGADKWVENGAFYNVSYGSAGQSVSNEDQQISVSKTSHDVFVNNQAVREAESEQQMEGDDEEAETGKSSDRDNIECRDNVRYGNVGQSVSNEDQQIGVSKTSHDVFVNNQAEREAESEQQMEGDDEEAETGKSSDRDNIECRDNVRYGNVGQSMSNEDQPNSVSKTTGVFMNNQAERDTEDKQQRRPDNEQEETGKSSDLNNAEYKDNVRYDNVGQSVSNEYQQIGVSKTSHDVFVNNQAEREAESEQQMEGDDEEAETGKSSDCDNIECRDNVRYGNVGQSVSNEDQQIGVSKTSHDVFVNNQAEMVAEREQQKQRDDEEVETGKSSDLDNAQCRDNVRYGNVGQSMSNEDQPNSVSKTTGVFMNNQAERDTEDKQQRRPDNEQEETGKSSDLNNAEYKDNVRYDNVGQSVSNEYQQIGVSKTSHDVFVNNQAEREAESEQQMEGDDEEAETGKSSDCDNIECRDNVRYGNVGQSVSNEDQQIGVSKTSHDVFVNNQAEMVAEREQQKQRDDEEVETGKSSDLDNAQCRDNVRYGNAGQSMLNEDQAICVDEKGHDVLMTIQAERETESQQQKGDDELEETGNSSDLNNALCRDNAGFGHSGEHVSNKDQPNCISNTSHDVSVNNQAKKKMEKKKQQTRDHVQKEVKLMRNDPEKADDQDNKRICATTPKGSQVPLKKAESNRCKNSEEKEEEKKEDTTQFSSVRSVETMKMPIQEKMRPCDNEEDIQPHAATEKAKSVSTQKKKKKNKANSKVEGNLQSQQDEVNALADQCHELKPSESKHKNAGKKKIRVKWKRFLPCVKPKTKD